MGEKNLTEDQEAQVRLMVIAVKRAFRGYVGPLIVVAVIVGLLFLLWLALVIPAAFA